MDIKYSFVTTIFTNIIFCTYSLERVLSVSCSKLTAQQSSAPRVQYCSSLTIRLINTYKDKGLVLMSVILNQT